VDDLPFKSQKQQYLGLRTQNRPRTTAQVESGHFDTGLPLRCTSDQ
jgi:hypothetical protein